MADQLVDVLHPDVGLSRVPKSTLHLWRRSGWSEVDAETVAELKELQEAKAEQDRQAAIEAQRAAVEAAREKAQADLAGDTDAPVTDDAATALADGDAATGPATAEPTTTSDTTEPTTRSRRGAAAAQKEG